MASEGLSQPFADDPRWRRQLLIQAVRSPVKEPREG